MFLNPLHIIIIVLVILIIVLFFCKNSVDQKRCNQPFFIPIQENINNHQNIEKFDTEKASKYNPLFGGKEIGFKSSKENGKMSFFVYTIDYDNNSLMEYDIIKNVSNIDSNFIKYDDNNEIGKKITINKPTSIRTCVTNNKNYITSFDKNSVYIVDTTDILENIEKTTIKTGKGPTYIDLYRPNDDDTIYGYTSNYDDNTVSILDLNENKNIKNIDVGKNPSFVCVAEKKKILFVANYSDNTISCFNLDNSGNVEKIDDYDTGKGPTSIEIDPDETQIFVTNYGDGTISVFHISEDEDQNKKIIKGSPIKIYDMAKPYSIDFNTKNKTGVILTNKGVYLFDTNNNDELIPVKFEPFP